MKLFAVSWRHNYGLGAALIKAESIEQARVIADNSDHIWACYTIDEVTNELFDKNSIFIFTE